MILRGCIVIMLRSLTIYVVKEIVADFIRQGAPDYAAAIPIQSQLLKDYRGCTRMRSIAYHMTAPPFPAFKDLSARDFSANEINGAFLRPFTRQAQCRPGRNGLTQAMRRRPALSRR